MRVRSGAEISGEAPDSSPVVLLVLDAITDFRFPEGREVLGKASDGLDPSALVTVLDVIGCEPEPLGSRRRRICDACTSSWSVR